MEHFILEYYQMYQFEFLGTIESTYLHGEFIRNEGIQEKLRKISEFEENEEEQGRIWYLDEEGYRLEYKELFNESPWSILREGTRKKIILRSLCDGSATFLLDS